MLKKQQTIKRDISYSGVGLHTGNKTTMTFKPAESNSGVRFKRADLPDAMDRISIIWRSEAIIPNLSLTSAASIPPQVQSDIKNAYLNLIAEESGKSIISDALQYDVQGFLAIEDDFFNELRELVKAANINPYQHLGN